MLTGGLAIAQTTILLCFELAQILP